LVGWGFQIINFKIEQKLNGRLTKQVGRFLSWAFEMIGGGTVDIPRQYIFTTIYQGALSDYEIKGSGKWENCGSKPKLLITYDVYYVGDEKGLAATYAAYLDGLTVLTADLTLSN